MIRYLRFVKRRCHVSDYDPKSQLITRWSLLNLRELGGMPLNDGRTFASGRFWRSSSPSRLSPDEVSAIRDAGVTTVIDFRSVQELERCGNPFLDDGITDFHSIPLFAGDPSNFKDKAMAFLKDNTLGDFYVIMINKLAKEIAQVMRILKDVSGITLFHCTHGKDRTGVITAILYLLAGACQEDIISNYKISYELIKPVVDPIIERAPDVMKHALRSDESNMETFLDYIDKTYNGDITSYLRSAGLTNEEISDLRSKCIG